MTKPEIICVGCPLGCRVTLTVGPDSHIESMVGNRCREGVKYVAAEFQNPARVFTATVLTESGDRCLLPVKTDRPVPVFPGETVAAPRVGHAVGNRVAS